MGALALENTQDVREALENTVKINEVVSAENRELKERLESASDTIFQYQTKAPRKLWEESTMRELSVVRKLLKAGKCEDGRYELDRVLDRLDPCWRTL